MILPTSPHTETIPAIVQLYWLFDTAWAKQEEYFKSPVLTSGQTRLAITTLFCLSQQFLGILVAVESGGVGQVSLKLMVVHTIESSRKSN